MGRESEDEDSATLHLLIQRRGGGEGKGQVDRVDGKREGLTVAEVFFEYK